MISQMVYFYLKIRDAKQSYNFLSSTLVEALMTKKIRGVSLISKGLSEFGSAKEVKKP